MFVDASGVIQFKNPAEVDEYGDTFFIELAGAAGQNFDLAKWNMNRNDNIAGAAGLFNTLWKNVIIEDPIVLSPFNWNNPATATNAFQPREYRYIIPRKCAGRRGVLRWSFAVLPAAVWGYQSTNTAKPVETIDFVSGGEIYNRYAGIVRLGFENPTAYGGDTGASAGYEQRFNAVQLELHDATLDSYRSYSAIPAYSHSEQPLRSILLSARDYTTNFSVSKKQTIAICGQIQHDAGSIANLPFSTTPNGASVDIEITYDNDFCGIKLKAWADNKDNTQGDGNLYKSEWVVNPSDSAGYESIGAVRTEYADGTTTLLS